MKKKHPKLYLITGRDFIDANDFKQGVKTKVDNVSIPPFDLSSLDRYQATIVPIQIVDLTLLDQPFRPFSAF